MRRSEREARACQLMCGRERNPENPYHLCSGCEARGQEIARSAGMRRVRISFMGIPSEGGCKQHGCGTPIASEERYPCPFYCVAHCITNKANHRCDRNRRRKARASYKERQRNVA